MTLVLKAVVLVLVAAAVLLVVIGQMGLFSGRPPQGLGVTDGRLKRPSYTPNSVSSQASLWAGHPQAAAAQIDPLPLKGTAAEAMGRLRAAVESLPGARVVEQRDDYLRAQFTTRLMKYVDDAEFWLDPAAGVIQVRSASRVGRKDFGVNRARIEALRQRLG